MQYRSNVVNAKDIVGVDVKNQEKDDLGQIEAVILDKQTGRVAYLVLSFGGFLGMGEKLFALPWNAITHDPNEDYFILNRSKESLKNAPGFNKEHWPDMADQKWGRTISDYYGTRPYWEE